jgi:phage terminase Nu1 subunit (DNA packaging protein)
MNGLRKETGMALIYRMKILLGVLQELGGQLEAARMQQMLFLYCAEHIKRDEYYGFIPLEGGPRSLQAEEDRRYLGHKKLLEPGEAWTLTPTDKRFAAALDIFEKIAIQDLKNAWAAKSDAEVAQHIAARHPDFAALAAVPEGEPVFYTIGYEGANPEAYINDLLKHGVRLLVDVRRNPVSKKYGFSKGELAAVLPRVGIEYLHLPELGIASEKRQNLESDRDYEALFTEYEQTTLAREQAALDRLERLLAEKRRIAITCFEALPHHCHRSRVASALKRRESFTAKIEHLQPCQHLANPRAQNARKYL